MLYIDLDTNSVQFKAFSWYDSAPRTHNIHTDRFRMSLKPFVNNLLCILNWIRPISIWRVWRYVLLVCFVVDGVSCQCLHNVMSKNSAKFTTCVCAFPLVLAASHATSDTLNPIPLCLSSSTERRKTFVFFICLCLFRFSCLSACTYIYKNAFKPNDLWTVLTQPCDSIRFFPPCCVVCNTQSLAVAGRIFYSLVLFFFVLFSLLKTRSFLLCLCAGAFHSIGL